VAYADAAQIVAAIPVAPFSSVRIPVESVVGDQNMRNSFIVSSDGAKGQILSTLRAIPGPGGEFVEIPREDRKKSTDGGQHPWIVDNSSDTYLVLFNPDKAAHTVGVSVYTTNASKASNGIAVNPNQTIVLDLGTLSDRLIHPDKAIEDALSENHTPRRRRDGLVTWLSLDGNVIFGRVIQISSSQQWSRNFSCPVEYIACGAYINPSSATIGVNASKNFDGYAYVCPSSGACTCDGGTACTGQTQVVPSNSWWIGNTSLAHINGSPYNSSVSVGGSNPGQTSLSLGVTDGSDYSCSADTNLYGQPATITVKRQPNHIKVVGDAFFPQDCPSGTSAVIRRISYEIDDSNNQPITPPISIREHFDGKSPSNGTSTCNNSPGQTTESCSAIPSNSVGFVDGISPGCAVSSAPTSCGYVWTNQAWYFCNSGGSDYVIGRPGTLNVTKGTISVGGNSTGFTFGTIFTGP
jgi:hypothetical protein